MVHYLVGRRRGGHGVGEDAFPLGEDQVGGDAQRPAFVTLGDEGEEDLALFVALGADSPAACPTILALPYAYTSTHRVASAFFEATTFVG